MRGVVAERGRAALQGYYDRWRELPVFAELYRRHAAEIVDAESGYYDRLFSGEMDRDYEKRVDAIVEVEGRSEMGARVHLGAATTILSVVFAEIGRRHRWSGPACASACAAVLRRYLAP